MQNNNYVKIPKDLAEIKQKFIFGLTKRQAICFGIGLAMGLPAFFISKNITDNLTVSIFALGIFAFPGVGCGLFVKNGIFLEQYIKLLIAFFKKPRVRTYQSLSGIDYINNQIEYNMLRRKLKRAGVYNFNKNEKKVKILEKLKSKN